MSKNNCCSSRSNRSEKDQKKIMVSRRFLQMPSELQELIRRKSENLENLNSMACRMTSQISEAPSHSGNPHAREAIIAKKMDLEKEIAGYREKLETVKAEVIMAILSLDNPDWQKALQYRFLDDMSNQDTANKMNVDIRTVQRYVEWGCFALKLPDRFYKKPPAA